MDMKQCEVRDEAVVISCRKPLMWEARTTDSAPDRPPSLNLRCTSTITPYPLLHHFSPFFRQTEYVGPYHPTKLLPNSKFTGASGDQASNIASLRFSNSLVVLHPRWRPRATAGLHAMPVNSLRKKQRPEGLVHFGAAKEP